MWLRARVFAASSGRLVPAAAPCGPHGRPAAAPSDRVGSRPTTRTCCPNLSRVCCDAAHRLATQPEALPSSPIRRNTEQRVATQHRCNTCRLTINWLQQAIMPRGTQPCLLLTAVRSFRRDQSTTRTRQSPPSRSSPRNVSRTTSPASALCQALALRLIAVRADRQRVVRRAVVLCRSQA
jgi:hypothetical protein